MAIVSVSDVKTYLGISGSSEDAFLAVAVASADAAIKSYLKRPVEQTTFTSYLNGNGRRTLYLPNAPVQSITSIHLDPDRVFGADTLLTDGADYYLEIEGSLLAPSYAWKGAVHRLNGVWPGVSRVDGLVTVAAAGEANIKVVYVAGWATVPADIKQAAYQYVTALRSDRGGEGPMQSESFDYYSRSRFSPEDEAKAFGSIKHLLSAYRKVVL